MARFKSFGSPVKNSDEPITFELYDETFTAKSAIQGRTLMGLAASSDATDPAESSKMVMDFFEETLVPESLERFNALTNSADKIVPVETLAEIVGWLVEQYSGGRPEEPRGD